MEYVQHEYSSTKTKLGHSDVTKCLIILLVPKKKKAGLFSACHNLSEDHMLDP